MSLAPSEVYSQSVDKQRIILAGEHHSTILRIVRFALDMYARKYDYVLDNENRLNNGPVVLLDASSVSSALNDFNHHILVISSIQSFGSDQVATLQQLADRTPKGGIIIYDEQDTKAKSVGSKERADITIIPYKAYSHKKENNSIVLVSSTNEKFPTNLSESDLPDVGAAREILKRVGISSGQFYRAMADFKK